MTPQLQQLHANIAKQQIALGSISHALLLMDAAFSTGDQQHEALQKAASKLQQIHLGLSALQKQYQELMGATSAER